MTDVAADALDELRRLAGILLEKGRTQFGFAAAAGDRYFAMATTPDSQAHLLGAVTSTLGLPDYFDRPRTILEAGCGTGSFLFAALTRGHDAYGIDCDDDRLAVARAKIRAFGYSDAWQNRLVPGDAESTPFDAGTFDVVLGHQFIEHVDRVPGTISELLRILKPGGFLVLYAPDYRAPYEAHYEMPWPPFASKSMAEAWVAAMDRPNGGIGTFNYVTLPQILAILQMESCDVTHAAIDRQIDPSAVSVFDTSSAAGVARSAQVIKAAMAAGRLPPNFLSPTSLAVAARKR